MKHIRVMDRNQVILFPEVIDDYITEENPVRFIDAFVESIDMIELEFKHAELCPTGRPPYDPADLLKLYIYGYLNRVRSSRFLEKECGKNVEVMWLLKKLIPDFKTIADFRKDNREAIKKVFKEFVTLCKKLDLFGGELVAIDSSKFKAVNSRKKNFHEGKLNRRLQEIDEKIEKYLKERKEVCYNAHITVDEKNKLILDHEVVTENDDFNHLNELSNRAKQILEVDKLEVVADANYYESEEIKKCIDNGVTPYIPERNPQGKADIDPDFYKSKFKFDKEKDVFICPAGNELRFWKRIENESRRILIR